jgi:hypothetical protein
MTLALEEMAEEIYAAHDGGDPIGYIVAAIQAERERAAAVAERIGQTYGEDETGWLDCSETIAASIRRG